MIKNSIFPGLILALSIALVAKFVENVLPTQLLNASVIALFAGILLNRFRNANDVFQKGVVFSSKKILKLAIILLGASLNISMILEVGRLTFIVLIFTLLTCFGGGYLIGKVMGTNWKLSGLISASTGICGGSAIVAIAPIIDADDIDMAYSLSATFLFDMVMIVIFPIMGRLLNLSDDGFGLWAGTTINDTSSVVAAGYAFSERAGDFATMVKLTRTLMIIPTVIAFTIISIKKKNTQKMELNSGLEDMKMGSVIPWFILGFVGFAVINSLGFIPLYISQNFKDVSKFLMISALAAIGLNTNLGDLRKAGISPMIHKIIVSLLVVIVALIVGKYFGII